MGESFGTQKEKSFTVTAKNLEDSSKKSSALIGLSQSLQLFPKASLLCLTALYSFSLLFGFTLLFSFTMVSTGCKSSGKKQTELNQSTSVSIADLTQKKLQNFLKEPPLFLGSAKSLKGFTPNGERVFYIQEFQQASRTRHEIFSLEPESGSTQQLTYQGAEISSLFLLGSSLFYTSSLDRLIEFGSIVPEAAQGNSLYRMNLKARSFESTGLDLRKLQPLGLLDPDYLITWEPAKALEVIEVSSRKVISRRSSDRSTFFFQPQSAQGPILLEVKKSSKSKLAEIHSLEFEKRRRFKVIASTQSPASEISDLQMIGSSTWSLVFKDSPEWGILREDCFHSFSATETGFFIEKVRASADAKFLYIAVALPEAIKANPESEDSSMKKGETFWFRLSLTAFLEASSQSTCVPLSELRSEDAIKPAANLL